MNENRKELLRVAEHARDNQMSEWAAFHRTFTPETVVAILKENAELEEKVDELCEEVSGLYAELDFTSERSWGDHV